MEKLTPKQELFCKNIVSGKSGIDSYKLAYQNNCNDTTCYKESLKLLKREDIQERIKALSLPLEIQIEKENLSARQEQINFIKERIAICKEKEDEQSIIRYTDMLNKIYGTYKEDTTGTKEENKLENIDTDKLLKLIG